MSKGPPGVHRMIKPTGKLSSSSSPSTSSSPSPIKNGKGRYFTPQAARWGSTARSFHLTFASSSSFLKNEQSYVSTAPKSNVKEAKEEKMTREEQRERMERIYGELKLRSLKDWIGVTAYTMKLSGGEGLTRQHNNNLKALLASTYPNYPWNFRKGKRRGGMGMMGGMMGGMGMEQPLSRLDRSSATLSTQRAIFDQLYYKFHMKDFEEWKRIPKYRITRHGGGRIFLLYGEDRHTLLRSLYPHYPWHFEVIDSHLSRKKFKSIESHHATMERLFGEFRLGSLDDWRHVTRFKLKRFGAGSIVRHYSNSLPSLLSSLYPNYPWNFAESSRRSLLPIILHYIRKYSITRKKDWYRVPYSPDRKLPLYSSLKTFYPKEKWRKSQFFLRTKKASQRLLYSFTRQIYPSLLIFENYFHPKLLSHQVVSHYELDLFIPALQLALEYQGQHHYDDLPSGFAGLDNSHHRDQVKEHIAKIDLKIDILYVPYWWDQSISSLRRSLQSFR